MRLLWLVHGAMLQVIDGLLDRECLPKIERRREEGEGLIKKVGLFLQMQAGHIQVRPRESGMSCLPSGQRCACWFLQEGCEALCSFVKGVAVSLEAHVKRETETDEYVTDELNGALDDFEVRPGPWMRAFRLLAPAPVCCVCVCVQEADLAREKDMERRVQQVRQAPDLAALEQRMTEAMQGLDDIEAGYRHYHSTACSAARLLPTKTGVNRRQYRRELCTNFGLLFPNAEGIDGQREVGEVGPVGVDGTPGRPRPTPEQEAEEAAAKEAAAREAERLRLEEEAKRIEEEKKAKKAPAKGAPVAPAEPVPPPEPVLTPEQIAEQQLSQMGDLVTAAGTLYKCVCVAGRSCVSV